MTTNVFIIGGGIIGSSIAYHLASKGCKDIIVIDNNSEPGMGSTGKATGGFRCQFATAINIQLSLLSRQKLLNFKDEIGTDPGYNPAGYLFVASNEEELNTLCKLQKLQKENGVAEVQQVSAEDILRLNPFLLENISIAGGVFSQTDGYIKPMNILTGYKNAAEKLGVKFMFDTECCGFSFNYGEESKKITEVLTASESFSVNYVINASGAWAAEIARLAGITLPVFPQRREIAVLKKKNMLSENMPMTIFINDGFHFRQRDGNVLLLHPEISEAADYDISVSERWLSIVKLKADKRIKNLQDTTIDRDSCQAGLYEVSPDKHCILGAAPGISNFYLANGSSGHGVMHSPAIGDIISDLVLNGSFNKFDISPLRYTRFEENDLNFVSDYL